MPDTAELELLDSIEDYVARAVAPLRTRIAELESQLVTRPIPERGADGRDGKDAEVDYGRLGEMLKSLMVPGKDGKDAEVDYDRIGNVIAVAVEKEVGKIPIPKNGVDGKDADEAAIAEEVLAHIPIPRDGADGREGPAGPRGEPGEPGPPGPAGERGSDGEKGISGDSGPPGEKGEPGMAGKDADGGKDGKDADEAAIIEKVLSRIPTPRDGTDGRDGRDAMDGLVGIKAELEGERELAIHFVRSNGVRTTLRAQLPIPIFRGVHEPGRKYVRGDNVTKNGCQWTCMADTTTTPPSSDWVQSTKAGRDGREK